MIEEASDVGELLLPLAEGRAEGQVSRTFQNSAYIRVDDGVVLLIRGELRSPMTVNLGRGSDLRETLSVGDRFRFSGAGLSSQALGVRTGRAEVYRSALGGRHEVRTVPESEILRGVAMLKMLYWVSDPGLDFVGGSAFGDFARSVLMPLSRGEFEGVQRPRNFEGLIGNGAGFTPAGDDFLCGFVVAFNFAAGWVGAEKVALPTGGLEKTVYESASILGYAQSGYVDEGLERLVLSSLGGRTREFRDALLGLASRGHTSGLDMSLGVLLAAASLTSHMRHDNALQSALMVLGSSQS